jgi:3-oxoacid CoA-transferase subunit B
MPIPAVGDLAHWVIDGTMVNGPGGAMFLVHGAKCAIVLMEHTGKDDSAKIVGDCSFPM